MYHCNEFGELWYWFVLHSLVAASIMMLSCSPFTGGCKHYLCVVVNVIYSPPPLHHISCTRNNTIHQMSPVKKMTSTRQWWWRRRLSSCRCLCIVVLLDKANIYLVHSADNEMTTPAMAMTARATVTVEVKKTLLEQVSVYCCVRWSGNKMYLFMTATMETTTTAMMKTLAVVGGSGWKWRRWQRRWRWRLSSNRRQHIIGLLLLWWWRQGGGAPHKDDNTTTISAKRYHHMQNGQGRLNCSTYVLRQNPYAIFRGGDLLVLKMMNNEHWETQCLKMMNTGMSWRPIVTSVWADFSEMTMNISWWTLGDLEYQETWDAMVSAMINTRRPSGTGATLVLVLVIIAH